MIQIKKTILTLVALLAVTTGAWADGIVCTASDLGKVLCTDGSIYENVSAATTAGKEAVAMIAYVDETNKNGLALALTDIPYFYTWDKSGSYNNGKTAPEICSALNTGKAVTGGTWKLPSQDEWKQMFSANGGNEESYTGLNTAIGNAGGTALLEGEDYWSSSEDDELDAWLVNLADGNASWNIDGKYYTRQVRACLAFDIASSGPEVAWDKAEKTGSFTMPGGNVTLEPEYYPQAELATGGAPTAINDVPATTDGAIVKAGTVANIGETTTAQGTLMYYVSQTALDDAALLALAADAWKADVPTAAHLTAGEAHVYYYVRGNDSDTDDENFSDGDILSTNALTVNIAAEPTYAVTFKAANANTIEAGNATVTVGGTDKTATVTDGKLKGVKMGSEVKLEANPGYKFRKVEVKKKAPAEGHALTSAKFGEIVGSDGKAYAAADKDNLPSGVTAVAMICYVSGSHGLALALTDEGKMNWSTAQTTCAAHTPAITGGTWKLASEDEWNNMIAAAGSYSALRDGFSSVGGSNLQSDRYWSSTEYNALVSWYYDFSNEGYQLYNRNTGYYVRACLAF